MNKRIEIIDIAKGISILMVAFYHSNFHPMFPEVLNKMGLFRLPLFFFLSGVFFKASIKPAPFIFGKTDALLKPYFITSFLLLVIPVVSGGKGIDWLAWKIEGILYASGPTIDWAWLPMWFLPHLWCLFIVSYGLTYNTKLTDGSRLIKCLFIIFLILFGSYFVDAFWNLKVSMGGEDVKLSGLPFSLDIIFLSMAFFMSGNFLKHKVIEFRPRLDILITVILIFFAIAIFTNAQIELNKRIYDEPLLATLAAISGIYFVLSTSYYLCKNRFLTRIFTTCGAASLFILIFHDFVNTKAYNVITKLSDFDNELVYAGLAFIISILVPLLIKILVQKNCLLMLLYFPFKTNRLFNRELKVPS